MDSAAQESAWAGFLDAAAASGAGVAATSLAARLLDRWCCLSGAAGAALYVREDGLFERERSCGAGDFPRSFNGEPAEELTAFPLPGGLLLSSPPAANQMVVGGGLVQIAAPTLDGAMEVLMAMAVRNARLERRLKRSRFAALHRNVEQQALYEVGLAITSTLDLEETSEAILVWALSLLDARCSALYLLDAESAEPVYRLTHALGGDARASFACVDDSVPEDVLPEAVHLLAVRIEIDSVPRGFLVVADKESRRGVGPFGEADRATLELFANQAAIALENARLHAQALQEERMQREMELAAETQSKLLPKGVPTVEGFELAGWNRPARQVGGDYYDLLPQDDGRLVLTLGDVTGKGMPAALMVSTLHSALRLMLDRYDVGPELFALLNRHIFESSPGNKFITLLVAQIDPPTGHVRYVNAGHNPAVLLRGDGTVRELPSGGPPIGLLPGVSYQGDSFDLEVDDLLCVYSDGITECAAPDGEEYELERLVELLQAHRGAPLPDIISAIDQATREFAEGQPQGDDQTVVLLRRVQ